MTDVTALIARHEGFRARPYRDTVGKLTIGYGRNLDDHGLTEDEAAYLLRNDVAAVQGDLRRVYPWFTALAYARQDAITDLVYNIGMTKFQKFVQTIAALEAEQYEEAAGCMMNSVWAEQVGARASELAAMIQSGQYQQ